MEVKELTAILVVATVGCILVAGFIPVVGESVSATTTFENEGLFNAKTIDETTEMSLTFDPTTNPNIITIDGVDIDMSDTPSTYGSVTVIFTDDWFARYALSNQAIAIYKCGTSSASAIGGASVANGQIMNITISGGSATITFGETTLNYSLSGDGLSICSEKGDYVVKTSNDIAHVNSDSVVYGVGRTDRALGSGSTSFNAMVKASVDDGVTPIYYSPQYTWNDNREVNATENTNYIDLYELSGFTFNLVDTDSVEHAITYNQIFVPREVTAEKVIHADDNTASIISMLPFILIMGIVLMFVGVVIVRRYV